MKLSVLPQYELLQRQHLDGIHSDGYLLRHKKSGARILCMENQDENKVFSIGFRTPPKDSTGVPHILEHSVLCGSKNFPVKDPFVELVKGSLNTFLNAMTYPDKTVYPVASCNAQDFQNLMHIYMDAVFYPNIYCHEEIFRQEGWSYHLESAEDELTYNGVVYNEMKGAFSSPEGVLDRVIQASLFPDTCYGNESGGDPEKIPDLTYAQFLDFHKTYYHPSNSYIYLYGDMDMNEKLCWLDREYLSDFDRVDIDSKIGLQQPFSAMKYVEQTYSITSSEPEEDNTYLSYSKVVGTALDRELYLAFEVLDYVLLSSPGAPLKKALLHAGIGKDIMGSYDSGICQPVFSIVAKNANAEQRDVFVKVIEDTLAHLAAEGIDRAALEAGIHYHEFRYREADFGSYPKGLMYGLQAFDSWLYDENEPFMHLEATDTFAFLKEHTDDGYFERLIREYLLDNLHGTVITVKPERGRTARMEKELATRLLEYKAGLSAEETARIVEDTHALAAYQESPERPEDMEKIPVLKREDITRKVAPVYNEVRMKDEIPVLFHNIETNGIGYIKLMFDLSGVPAEELPYVGILQSVLGMIDTEHYEYGELYNEIHRHTGGIGLSNELYPDMNRTKEKDFRATLEMSAKALYEKLPVAFDMMEEIMNHSQFDDDKRLKEILSMARSRMQMRFQSAGHVTAAVRALSYADPMYQFKEWITGIDYYRVLCRIEENFDDEKDMLKEKLQSLCRRIFTRGNLMVSCTASEKGLQVVEAELEKLNARLLPDTEKRENCVLHCEKKNEGFRTASKVQYVARAGSFADAGYEYTGALQILKVIMSYEYLWQNVRVKGGAYGCMSNFTRTGEGYFMSYRDPNLEKTNAIYDGVPEYLEHFELSDKDMTKYIVGTISTIDQPLTPSAKGERSMSLYMSHITQAMLQKERNEILDACAEDIRALAEPLRAVLSCNQLCVIGSEEKIMEQQELFKETKDLF